MLMQHVGLNPWAASAEDWRIARFLVASVALYGLPLALHALWDECLKERMPTLNSLLGETLVSLLAFCCVLVLRSESTSAFIYFQF